jgi:hypothetical protein
MAESVPQIRTKILRRQRTPDQYRLYRAALEWSLTDPIVIASDSDFQSTSRWRGQIEPCAHNLRNVITFCCQLPGTLLADEVGLGNTISAGLVASELISRARISKLLIVCPKILTSEWCHVLKAKFHIPARVVVGRDLMYAETEDVGAIITTYHSAWLYLDQIPNNRFDMLVLDQADKLRHLQLRDGDQPPHAASPFREALERRRFRYALIMTSRPIQDSLWDLYGLVDLLAAARGHANPFGSEEVFAWKFIADDDHQQARQLKPEVHEEFRSIVDRYMSRLRREDIKLNFPNRLVQSLPVEPNAKELELIQVLTGPIRTLNPSAQIALLFALTSSPNALLAQVNAMAQEHTVPEDLAAAVRDIVDRMPLSGKLEGLSTIIDRLRLAEPDRWRLVIFTGSVETQKRIQVYLERRRIPVAVINGSSNPQDQETLASFRKSRPQIRVIVCSDADSEVLDLPLATTVVNYDLPWNPVIAERRIGQFQRLWSNRTRLNIFNLTLRGTFEEHVVSRVMGRLLTASRAIDDIEPLLHSSAMVGDDDGDVGFDEKILQLALASLAGEDVETAVQQIELSITTAKAKLEREEQNNSAVLGAVDGAEQLRQQVPILPPVVRSMDAPEFARQALNSLGAKLAAQDGQIYLNEQDDKLIRFDWDESAVAPKAVVYAPGSSAFFGLVNRTSASGIHSVDDLDHRADQQADKQAIEVARRWASEFGASLVSAELRDVRRAFDGMALVHMQASVVHDSYERLLEISCGAGKHNAWSGRKGLAAIPGDIQDVASVGINSEVLFEAAGKDPAIGEFCRFYLARRKQEVSAGGADAEKRRLLGADFTPRFEMTLAGIRGAVHRQLKLRVYYKWDKSTRYSSDVVVSPYFGTVLEAPAFDRCAQTGQLVPVDCLERCEITGLRAIKHELVRSHISGRFALFENTLMCNLSRQRILLDEARLSDATGQIVASSLLKGSGVSGKLAEPEQFAQCEFTQVEALHSELGVSEISGKRYRLDEQTRSVVSGKVGHYTEFVLCDVTQQPFAPGEGENCEITGHLVVPSVLERCSVSGKTSIPSELEQCASSGQWAQKKYFVASSISGARVLERYALRSAKGKFCTPLEGKRCMWSGRNYHPDDLRTCALTGVLVHFQFVTSDAGLRLQPLRDLLYGFRRTADASDLWESIAAKASVALGGGRCRLEAAQTSPDGRHLAVCSEVRSFLGRSVRQAGLLYSFRDDQIIGRIALGKRSPDGWTNAGR